jgi:flagellar protein FliO/FliZ
VQFITSLFGGSGNTILTMLFALGAVIVLILLAVWLLRFVFDASGNAVRGRNRRLSVVDTLAIDQKRQLVIIRRDDVEHLILTGGPQDVVVETGIPVEEAQPVQTTRRPLPIVPGRKVEPKAAPAPAPTPVAVAPVTPPEPAPVVQSTPAVTVQPLPEAQPGTVLEHLRQQGHAGDRKTRVSLRHTGLLKPVTVKQPAPAGQNPDISPGTPTDSAKQSSTLESESDTFEHNPSSEPNRG